MIVYNGTNKKDNISYICFKNDKGKVVEIPVSDRVLSQFLVYLEKLQPPEPKTVEYGNDELQE